jgi:hypothetical protein
MPSSPQIRSNRYPDGFIVFRTKMVAGFGALIHEYLNQSARGWAAFASVFVDKREAEKALADEFDGEFGCRRYKVVSGSD